MYSFPPITPDAVGFDRPAGRLPGPPGIGHVVERLDGGDRLVLLVPAPDRVEDRLTGGIVDHRGDVKHPPGGDRGLCRPSITGQRQLRGRAGLVGILGMRLGRSAVVTGCQDNHAGYQHYHEGKVSDQHWFLLWVQALLRRGSGQVGGFAGAGQERVKHSPVLGVSFGEIPFFVLPRPAVSAGSKGSHCLPATRPPPGRPYSRGRRKAALLEMMVKALRSDGNTAYFRRTTAWPLWS